jgi:hypothetical protein
MNPHDPPTREPGFEMAIVSLVIAVGSLLFPLPGIIELYNIPPGTACRPMGIVAFLFLASILGPLFTLVLAVPACFRGRISRRLAIIAGILSFVPFPLYRSVFHWIVVAHNLTLEA